MCWSKRSSGNETMGTTPRPMDTLSCPIPYEPHCSDGNAFCHDHGLCCINDDKKICVCHKDYKGLYCENKKFILHHSEEFEKTKVIIIFSAILGVIVITFFVVLVALQIKYYRNRKKGLLEDDKELDAIAKPDAEEKEKHTKKHLAAHPGYSWRESVHGHSRRSQMLEGPSSRSFPDDLFQVGLKLAAVGGREGGGGGGEGKPTNRKDLDTHGNAGDAQSASPDCGDMSDVGGDVINTSQQVLFDREEEEEEDTVK